MANRTTATPPSRDGGKASAGLRLTEASALLEVSPSTLRRYVKAGKLKASQITGKYGPEYRIRPAVLKAFALETLDLNLRDEDLEGVESSSHRPDTPPPPPAYTALYERLIELTGEVERYRALSEVSDSSLRAAEADFQEQVGRLTQENKALEERLAALEGRGLWARIRGRER